MHRHPLVRQRIIDCLKMKGRGYIELSVIEKSIPGDICYKVFAESLIEIINQEILKPVKKKETNHKNIPLALKYSINYNVLFKDYHNRINKIRNELNEQISLDEYYKKDETIFEGDLPAIYRINQYLNLNGISREPMSISQLSYNMTGEEKWIEKHKGKTILKRLKLWDQFSFIDKLEPIAFGIDLTKINQQQHYHLIIENKTPFNYCIKAIEKSIFTTIIYGSGWQVASSIDMFIKQINIKGDSIFYYYGDIDKEGLYIWYRLYEKIHAIPATIFYQSMLQLESNSDKLNQRLSEASLNAFKLYFDVEKQVIIDSIIKENKALPQEMLNQRLTIEKLLEMNKES